jgi:hypothetical protein
VDNASPLHSIRSRSAAALVLLLLILVAYWPSLGHLPRSDQLDWLANTLEWRGRFWELLRHTYSYNRTRVIAPGDASLFRPLFFAVVAAEDALFRHHFALQQAVGIALHAAIAWTALRMAMASERPGIGRAVAFTWVAFFSVGYVGQEMVIFSHLHGYLMFLLLALLALERGLEPGFPRARGAWVLAFFGAFLHELGQPLALVLAWPAWRAGKRRAAVAFVGILAIYQVANFADQRLYPDAPKDAVPGAMLERAVSVDTLENLGRFLRFSLLQPFFPEGPRTLLADRTFVEEASWDRLFHPSLLVIAGLAAALLAAGLTAVAWLRAGAAARASTFWFLSVPVAFVLVYVLGRVNVRTEQNQLELNPYYAYVPLLFVSIAAARLWSDALPFAARAVRRAAMSWACCTLVVASVSFWRVRAANAELALRMERVRALTEETGAFLARHPGESFAFDTAGSVGVPAKSGIPFPTLLFRDREDVAHPRHVISWPRSGFKADPVGPERAIPRLVEVREKDNLFELAGKSYVIAHDGVLDPARLPPDGAASAEAGK